MDTQQGTFPVNGTELVVAMGEILGFLEELVKSPSEAADRLAEIRRAFDALEKMPLGGEIYIKVGPQAARTFRGETRPTEGGAVGTKRVSC